MSASILDVLLERRAPVAPIEHAVAAAVRGDRLGTAFAAGYQAALMALFPDLGAAAAPASLCVTEAGGNHPKHIATTFDAAGLHGDKTFVTDVGRARTLLVLASAGARPDGQKDLCVVRLAVDAPGVTLTPLPATPFCPEMGHARVHLAVPASAVERLPGDGWTAYVKPFRTIEDIHVNAAGAAYLFGVTRRAAAPDAALAALVDIFATLAAAPPDEPATHVRLAGAIALLGAIDLTTLWAAAPADERARWERDRALLGVAGRARAARLAVAWAALTS